MQKSTTHKYWHMNMKTNLENLLNTKGTTYTKEKDITTCKALNLRDLGVLCVENEVAL